MYDAICGAVKALYGKSMDFYLCPSHKRNVVDVRNMAMSIYRAETDCSLSQMEIVFHRHHATILYGISQVNALRETLKTYDSEYKNLYQKFTELL